ncbi:hypothetical protein HMPREF1117_1101 [Streptococcus sp. SK643]|nr:hypothetical protein HMPREF1117_1101 [Streptococcus sp. SK643]
MTDGALIISTTSRTGRPILSKMVPFTLAGNKGTSEPLLYKYLEIQGKAVTADEYQKAQEELAKHVK